MYLTEQSQDNTHYVTKNTHVRAARIGVFPLEVEAVTSLAAEYGINVGIDAYYDNIGSWLVVYNTGEFMIVPDQLFRLLFDRVANPGKET